MSKNYHVVMTDDIPMILRGQIGGHGEDVGRALTRRDGEAIVAELNRLEDLHNDALREALLSGVTDAIENCFEERT